jgi:hypothetical protein
MKLNYFGIAGAIIVFVSIALPWWTVSETALGLGATYNWYLYNAGTYGAGLNLWYNWVALLLVILGGIIGIAGSILPDNKKMLMGGGILALLSIIIFAAGLQTDLSSHNLPFGIFSSGTLFSVSFSTYLSYGFWLTLVAAIIMLIAMRYPKLATQAPAPPPSSPLQPPSQPPLPTETYKSADIN